MRVSFKGGLEEAPAKMKAASFWGSELLNENADLYTIKKAAAKRFSQYNAENPNDRVAVPIIDLVDPKLIKKAVFDPSYGNEGFARDFNAAKDQFVNDLTSTIIKKATTTASNMIHSIADQEVTMLFKRVYVLQALIDVEPNIGKYAQWDAIGPYSGGSASFAPEDGELIESDMQDFPRIEPVKILQAMGRVTKLTQMAGASQVPVRDFMAIRMLGAMEMIKQLRERRMLGVNSDVTSKNLTNQFTPAGTLEYKGLYEIIKANTEDPCYVTAPTNTSTWSAIEPLFNLTHYNMVSHGLNPNLSVCDYKTFHIIRQGMNDRFRSENMKETNWGIAKITLETPSGPIPLIPEYFLPGTAGPNGSMFLLDTVYLKRRVLYPEMYLELAQTNTSRKFVVDAAEVPIDKTDVDGSHSFQGGVFGITLT